MIPKNIIYVWFGKSEYPKSVSDYIKNWKKINPNFNFIKIDESNFNIDFCNFTKVAYEDEKMAFVSDVARIWAINKFGGIYLDTDVELIKKLDDFLQYRQFWAEEDAGFVNSGLIFGSEPNSPILEEILDVYKNIEFSNENIKKISTVKIVSNILREHGLKYTNKNQLLNNEFMVFGPNYFAPFHYWGGGKIRKETVAIHHYNASWCKKSNSFINYVGHEVLFNIPILSKIYKR
ncbi:glycosyltransferase [Limosilactobacillus reuteri]|uniref:glycosyltransferase family 32 protein n=1 Tax=Limosilactobacillus reuteri TaxID=1598 RepID=UPI002551DDBE|nr:glycosyltransferase [Limosilactobacillus reuteri]MDL2058152.1 glycosyltransferase [Limosilactobacillus reuteri]